VARTADVQCGAGDLCTYVGSMGQSYCLQACGSGCPTGYACSAGDVYSVDGGSARQCVPNNGSCTMPTAACVDDDNEDDDSQSQASANAMADGPAFLNLEENVLFAVSCPKPVQPTSGSKADDDWRQPKLTQDTLVDMSPEGAGERGAIFDGDALLVGGGGEFRKPLGDRGGIQSARPRTGPEPKRPGPRAHPKPGERAPARRRSEG